MQCRRPFGAAVPPFGGITRPPAGGGQASAGLAAGGNGAAGHGAAGTVPGGYGASIEARFHRARHLVPAKAGTVSPAARPWGGYAIPAGPQSRRGAQSRRGMPPIPNRGARSSGHAVLLGMQSRKSAICSSPQPLNGAAQSVKVQQNRRRPCSRRPDRAGGMVRNPSNGAAISRHGAIRKSASGGGGTAGPIGPAGTVPPIGGTEYGAGRHGVRCRAIGRHGVWCRPTGRRKTAWQRPGSKPAAALLPAGPIGPAERCRQAWCRQSAARPLWCLRGARNPSGVRHGHAIKSAICPSPQPLKTRNGADTQSGRHGVWCRLLAARYGAAPAMGRGTVVWCRRFHRARYLGGTVPGGAVLGRREQSADWRTVFGRAADRNWGLSGRDAELGNAESWGCGCPGTRSLGMRMSWEYGVWECGCPGNAEPGNADVLGMRMSWSVRMSECGVRECGCPGLPGCLGSGNGAESGDCPPAQIGPAGAVPPDSGGTEWCRLLAARGGGVPPPGMVPPGSAARYVVPPCWAARFRRRLAEPPADRPAAGGGGGCSEVPGVGGGPRKDAWGRPGSGR